MKGCRRAAGPGALALALALCVLLAVPALAADGGSITLRTYPPAEDALALSGDGYSLARTAALSEDGGYVWEEAFASLASEDVESLSDSERMALARALADCAGDSGLYTAAAVTDADGRAAFTGLAPGLYLLARTDPAPENAAYEAAPLLIAVPSPAGDGLTYDVTVDMKFAAAAGPPEVSPTPVPEPTPPPGERLAQTGQLNWPIPFLAGAGVCLFLIGLALLREAREEEEKAGEKG